MAVRLGPIALALLLGLPFAARAAPDPPADRISAYFSNDSDLHVSQRLHSGVELALTDQAGVRDGTIQIASSPPMWEVPRVETPDYYVTVNCPMPGRYDIARKLIRAADSFVSASAPRATGLREPRASLPIDPLLPRTVAVVALAALWAGLLHRARIIVDLKLPHVIPVILQLILFAYFWVYWPGVAWLAPLMGLELALAYACEALFSILAFRSWKVGFGPLPMVLSANLFAWFNAYGAIAFVVFGIGSRVFLRYRGKHLLNPSAAGLSFAFALTYAFPSTFIHSGPFTLFSLAPNMSELIILVALLPQLRFRIVLASIAAFLSFVYLAPLFGPEPNISQPGLLLMMTLFLTDPSTMPRSPLGQVVFGVVVGVSIGAVTHLGYALGAHDERMNKVLPVVLGNLLVPWLDAAAARLSAWRAWLEPRLLGARWNLAHVALWIALVVPIAGRDKPQTFNACRLWSDRVPILVRDADDVPRCEHNPVYCRPFSFRSELAAWAHHLRARAPAGQTRAGG